MRYPLSSPDTISREAVEAGVAVLRSGRFTMGPKVEEFEDAVARFVGAKHAVMVNSGSSANLLAAELLRIRFEPQQFDLRTPRRRRPRLLAPALAWPTSVWPFVQRGFAPTFVDVHPVMLSLDWSQTAEADAAVLIHVLGSVGPTPGADSPRFPVIHDACEGFGSVKASAWVTTYSHFFSHQLSTMEGGTICVQDDWSADYLRSLRSHGWTRQRSDRAQWERQYPDIDPRFLFATMGYNVRPLEVEAAMGLVALRDLPRQLEQRRRTSAAIQQILPSWLTCPNADLSVAWMNLPLVVSDEAPVAPRDLQAAFEAAGIETRPILAGNLLRHPVMKNLTYHAPQPTPVADRLMARGFMMGCWGEPQTAVDLLLQALDLAKVTVAF